jgi:hypothetical protein
VSHLTPAQLVSELLHIYPFNLLIRGVLSLIVSDGGRGTNASVTADNPLFDKTPVGETDDLTEVAEIPSQTQDIMMRRYTQYSESSMRYGHFAKFDEDEMLHDMIRYPQNFQIIWVEKDIFSLGFFSASHPLILFSRKVKNLVVLVWSYLVFTGGVRCTVFYDDT